MLIVALGHQKITHFFWNEVIDMLLYAFNFLIYLLPIQLQGCSVPMLSQNRVNGVLQLQWEGP